MAMLIAIGNGCQACIMAPTEILAEQHLATIRQMLEDMDIHVELLTGVVKGRRRADILDRLSKGEIDILVGTHAVIEDAVVFARLGLAVVDEQHRFGVAQRPRLPAAAGSSAGHSPCRLLSPAPRVSAHW